MIHTLQRVLAKDSSSEPSDTIAAAAAGDTAAYLNAYTGNSRPESTACDCALRGNVKLQRIALKSPSPPPGGPGAL